MSEKIDIGDLYKQAIADEAIDPGDALWDSISTHIQPNPLSGSSSLVQKGNTIALKIIYGIVAASIIGTISYFLWNNSESKSGNINPSLPPAIEQRKEALPPFKGSESNPQPKVTPEDKNLKGKTTSPGISGKSNDLPSDTTQTAPKVLADIGSGMLDTATLSAEKSKPVPVVDKSKKTPIVIVKKDTIIKGDTIGYKNKRDLRRKIKADGKL